MFRLIDSYHGGGVENNRHGNKGFTLAELLAVIAILGIISLIVFPSINEVIKNSKEKAYNIQKDLLINIAKNWALEHTNELSEENDTYVTIDELIQGGYIENEQVINPITDEEMNGCIVIHYKKSNNKYTYSYNEASCDELSTLPIITLNGDKIVTIGIGKNYQELGATANYKGTDISSSITITNNINTNQVGTYQVRYNVTHNGLKAKEVIRTVNVIDNSPVITLKGESTVIVELNGNYTEPGATAKTHDGIDISSSITITNNINTSEVGTYQVRYNVTHNGLSAKEIIRTVKVVDKSPIIVLNPNGNDTYQKSVTVTVTATPYSGNTISSIKYKLDNGAEQTVSNNKITINTNGNHTLTVTATDQEGNSGSITSNTYLLDTVAPTITFEEGDTAGIILTVSQVASYNLKTGVSVTDNNAISLDNVTTSGDLSASVGNYTITYTATDIAGNVTTKTRKVTVKEDCPTVVIMGKNVVTCDTKTNDPGGNLRFVGKDPNNYVKFNNELWRIIGVFNGQAKIMKNDYYNRTIGWDIGSGDIFAGGYSGYSNWINSSLQKELNGTYLNGIEATSKSYIDTTHVWNLGGAPEDTDNWTRTNMYSYERGTTVYSDNPTTWTGAIGLMYPSDYAYSTSSENVACDTISMKSWCEGGNVCEIIAATECRDNSWIYDYNNGQWTITHVTNNECFVASISTTGQAWFTFATTKSATRPVLFLKSNVKIASGSGSQNDPFIPTQ